MEELAEIQATLHKAGTCLFSAICQSYVSRPFIWIIVVDGCFFLVLKSFISHEAEVYVNTNTADDNHSMAGFFSSFLLILFVISNHSIVLFFYILFQL